jgi:hypothetical protein
MPILLNSNRSGIKPVTVQFARWLRSELCERLETTPDRNGDTVTDRGQLRSSA